MLGGLAVAFIPSLKEEKRRRDVVLSILVITLFLTVWQLFLPQPRWGLL